MTYAIHDAGSYKTVKNVYNKVSGSWLQTKGGFVKVSGTWKNFFLRARAFVGGGSVTFNTDGTATGTGDTDWAPTGIVSSGFWIRCTRTSGNPGTNFASAGTWRSLASNLAQGQTGVGACAGTIEFATDSSGVNIIGNSTLILNNAA